jgi:thiol-disulfide isomerase/thioredoxin
MKHNLNKLYFLIALFLIICVSTTRAQNKLSIGDMAPALKVSKWLKGTPVTGFEKGKVYVVEFWATWCAPCKKSIPHLTELAHKYKDKITFIGMDASESTATQEEKIKLVEEFLKSMGDKMDYNVALDSEDKFMSLNWMTAAAQKGIPCAFVVNQNCQIVWIGLPANIDLALEQIIAGNFDIKAYAESLALEEARKNIDEEKFTRLTKDLMDAYKNKDYNKVVSEYERIISTEPVFQSQLDVNYFEALAFTKPDKLLSIANELKMKNDSYRLETFCYTFSCKKGIDNRIYDFVINYLAPKIEKNPNYYDYNDYKSLSWLQLNYQYSGNIVKAIATVQKMIDYTKLNGSKEELQFLEKRIVELKASK